MIVAPVENPNFVRHTRRVRAQSVILALHIDDALTLFFVLADDVAKDAALALAEPFAGGIEFILDAARDKNCGRNLGMCVGPFVASERPLVLEHGNIFETRILLQVGDARGPYPKDALDLFVV